MYSAASFDILAGRAMLILPSEIDFVFGSNGDAIADVSVIVSLYNYADVIEDCLESIKRQQSVRLELVIVNDASTDTSRSVVHRWLSANAASFHRVLLINNSANYGLAITRNNGVAASSGSYIFIMDADNRLYPSALRKHLFALRDSEAVAAYSQLRMFESESRIGYADFWSRRFLAVSPYIDAMALIRKDAYVAIGGYSHVEGGWEDYDFWCKIAEQGYSALFIPEILTEYRVHGRSMLRTESINQYDALKARLIFRHHWLEIR